MSIVKTGQLFGDQPAIMAFKYQTFCFTGRFGRYTKKELGQLVTNGGGQYSITISYNVSVLVVAHSAGTTSKKRSAASKGIKIITESEFYQLLADNNITL